MGQTVGGEQVHGAKDLARTGVWDCSRLLHDNGLLLASLGLFGVFFLGMIFAGAATYNQHQHEHGSRTAQGLDNALSDHRGFRRGEFENWESEFMQMGRGVLGSKMAAPQRFRNCQRIFETALRRLKLAAIPPQSLSLKSCSPPNSFDGHLCQNRCVCYRSSE